MPYFENNYVKKARMQNIRANDNDKIRTCAG